MKAPVHLPADFDWQSELTGLVHMLGAFSQLTVVAVSSSEPLRLDAEELHNLVDQAWQKLSLIDAAAGRDTRLTPPKPLASGVGTLTLADQVRQARELAAG